MTIGDRGPAARAERVRGAYSDGDLDDLDREWDQAGGGGLTRTLVVVILLHVVGIVGVLGYRWMHRDAEAVKQDALTSTQAERPPVADVIPPPRTNGKSLAVEHPTLKGHVSYRIGNGETLQDVARRYNATVPEVEKLNSLRADVPLYPGQWLIVPDRRGQLSGGSSAESKPGPEKVASPEAKTGMPPSKVQAIPPAPVAELPPPPARAVPLPPAPGSTPGSAQVQTYKVLPGDTAYRIALRHGITWQELMEFNGMSDPKQLRAGQTLKIPAKR